MADIEAIPILPNADFERANGRVVGSRMSIAVMAILGTALLFAAAMKAYAPDSEASGEASWLASPGIVLAAIEMEIGLGIWLLCGIHQRLAWRAAVSCFIIFVGVSMYKGLTGSASCGCLGRLRTNPWYMVGFDLVAIIGLLLFRPRSCPAGDDAPSQKRVFSTMAIAVVCAVVGAWVALSRVPQTLAAEDGLEAVVPSSVVLLEPKNWLGKHFPLTRYLQIGSRLQTGRWLAVLYHADCPVCQKAILHFGELAQAGYVKLALIEIPPHQPEALELAKRCSVCLTGMLSADKDWFAATPVVMLIEDNIVQAVAEGEDSLTICFNSQRNVLVGFSHTAQDVHSRKNGR